MLTCPLDTGFKKIILTKPTYWLEPVILTSLGGGDCASPYKQFLRPHLNQSKAESGDVAPVIPAMGKHK
jgi:hypothetical protein